MATTIRVPFAILQERTTDETSDALVYLDFGEHYGQPTAPLSTLIEAVNRRLGRLGYPEVVDGLQYYKVRPLVR